MTTATFTPDIEAFIDALAADPTISDADVYNALTEIQTAIGNAAQSLVGPMTHSQRGAMFAAFTEVFGSQARPARRVFTRLVLGRPADAPVSWADNGTGSLTRREASKVLSALGALKEGLDV